MSKLTEYLGKTILIAILLALTLLVGMEFIFSLVNELRYVGVGDYSLAKALLFIFLSLPDQLAQMFPMSALVGTLMGLGWLASHSELVIMQVSGLSKIDIIFKVLKLALLLVIGAWVLGEGLAPVTKKLAHTQKATALSAGQALRTVYGTWMKDGEDFIHIQSIEDNHLQGITRYQFNANMQLKKASFAHHADFQDDHWILYNIEETVFTKKRLMHNYVAQQKWVSDIDPDILRIIGVKELDELSLTGLWQAIKYRQANELEVRSYQLAFWQKMVRPVATLVMMFLAIPFIFGPLRSATMGFRMVVGILIGFVFYTFNQLFGPLTLVSSISPLVGAWLPTLFFLGIGLMMLRKN